MTGWGATAATPPDTTAAVAGTRVQVPLRHEPFGYLRTVSGFRGAQLRTGTTDTEGVSKIRSLAASGVRIVERPAFHALLARRQLNMPRWARGREFRDLHAVSVAWMDSHFELIERRAPWLQRVGSGSAAMYGTSARAGSNRSSGWRRGSPRGPAA